MAQQTLFTRRIPLAFTLRPKTLDEIVGQPHLLSRESPLRKLIEADLLSSLVLGGPAGTGKTTIAEVIARITKSTFLRLNATSATIKDIRQAGQAATERGLSAVMFMDECHRMTRVQEDAFLPFVESGALIFIGATTENVFHSIHSPLLSRSQIFILEPLSIKDLLKLILRGIDYYRNNEIKEYRSLEVDVEAAQYIAKVSCGDGRKAISLLEMAVEITENNHITQQIVESIAPSKYMVFSDDTHFDLASWLQGAIQASDPDAAVFALAKWLEAGEDPRYIARRIMVSASEDAAGSPEAALVAHNAFLAACEIGRPECDIVLAHAVTLIASCPRDKSSAKAVWAAVKDVRDKADVEVPKKMRDGHYPGAEKLGHGAYQDGSQPMEYVGIKRTYYHPPATSKYKNPNIK